MRAPLLVILLILASCGSETASNNTEVSDWMFIDDGANRTMTKPPDNLPTCRLLTGPSRRRVLPPGE